jgi:hypothetical protein
MKRAPWKAILFALPFCAFSQSEQVSAPSAITVYTQFDHDYSSASIEQMKEELVLLMSPLGLDIAWRDLNRAQGNEVSAELVVVTFKGSCDMQESIPAGVQTGALGWTHMSDGAILPFSDVDCDKIRRFIAPELRFVAADRREVVYGKAMGRVLAHELYHVFTNTTRHAGWGIAKGFYTSRDLVAERFEFREKDTVALRSGKLKNLLRNRKPPVLGFARH